MSQYLASDDANPEFVGASNPDNRLHARFYRHPLQNNFKSEQEGRPIFDEVDMIEIHVPGDKDLAVNAIVRQDHKNRFPQQWAIYQNKMQGDQMLAGKTPLSAWPRLTPAQVAELGALKFRTVEDIAHASDSQLQSIGMIGGMSFFAFRDHAARFLKLSADESAAAKSDAAVAAVTAENNELKERMAAMESRFAQLAQQTTAAPVPDEPEAPATDLVDAAAAPQPRVKRAQG